MIKRLDFFAKVQFSFNLASSQDIQSQLEKFQNSLMSTLHHVYCTFAVHYEKSLVPCFLRSPLINYFLTLSLEKYIIVLEKKCGKSLLVYICFRDMSFQERKIICSSATASQTDNTLPFIIIFYDDVLFS